ncbi:Imm61 family immunity protein [Microbacterium sp. BWT-B31]|uniref:Imm61 family immunity protein n=1 Tax=Microbacterium sp. BWT-B31 TaxID=3232072 RepID=UPI0035282C39
MTAFGLTEVADWLAETGRAVQQQPTGLSVADDEVTMRIAQDDHEWVIHKTWRDEDRGVVFTSPSVEDVDRYLTLLTANEVRSRKGLPPLRHGITTRPDGIAEPSNGLNLSGDLDRGFVLTDPRTGEERRFASDIEAARFSRYIGLAPGVLRSAILSSARVIDVPAARPPDPEHPTGSPSDSSTPDR